MRWLKTRYKKNRLIKRALKKHADHRRPIRICLRLQLRIDELGDVGKALLRDKEIDSAKAVLQRMDVLTKRMRRVRDYQIKEWGH